MSIQPLPPDVIAQIKSSTTITSLNGVTLELAKNSLDAGSTKVDISIDYSRGGCVVEDNGLGIPPSEFGQNGGLGKLYHSSKLNSQTPVHGGRGTFITYLGAMSFMVITSHHHQHRSHNSLTMHKSEIVSRQLPAPAQQYLSHSDHGTRVTVRDLFGSMPVRVKQRAITSEKQSSKDWESLKGSVVLLCLAWPVELAVTLRELATNQRMVIRGSSECGPKTEIFRVCSILCQSSFIAPEDKTSWVSIKASTSSLEVSGTISLDPSPTKHVQFISFDIQPVLSVKGQSILQDEINRLFMNSAFGNEAEADDLDGMERSRRAKDARYKGDGFTNRELKGGKKGVDRWPMFYLNIQRAAGPVASLSLDADDILDNKANSLSAVIVLLQAMILEFLTKYHFRPRAPRGQSLRNLRLENGSPNVEQASVLSDCKMVKFADSLSANLDSPKPSKIERKKSIRIPNSHTDILGTNVKLPSFRQSSSFDSPFDAWSRIKSGTIKPALHNPSNLLAASEIKRSSTAPPALLPPTIGSKPVPHSTPLLSSTGNITRRPFDDISTCSSRSKSIPLRRSTTRSSPAKPIASQKSPGFVDLTKDNDDETLRWINPITKVESVVNKRTGHTVAAANHQLVARLSRSSSIPNLPSRQKLQSDIASVPSQPSSWLSNLLERWENPVFRPTEPSIPQVSLDGETEHVLHGHRHNCTQLDINRAFTEASSGIQGRISKSALLNSEVIGQVDRKFILAKLLSCESSSEEKKTLVIIDQHAADERIRVESLLAELCTPRLNEMPGAPGVLTTDLEKKIIFEVSDKDIEILRQRRAHFAEWGICYELPPQNPIPKGNQFATRKSATKQKFTVRSLPPGIIERCRSDPKLLLDFIRTELYSNSNPSSALSGGAASETDGKAWLRRIHNCPQGILDMINSRACRSAIMFNDVLSKEQCEILVRKLADTAFPFQCAHGRPSLLPLVELGGLGQAGQESEQIGQGFGSAFRKWKMPSGSE